MPTNSDAIRAAINKSLDWIKTHSRTSLLIFLVWILFWSFVRTRLDIYKSYEGIETTAMYTWGFVELFVVNAFFIFGFWVFLRVAPLSLDQFLVPVRLRDFGLILGCAILLPSLLNMDVKVVQVVPGATQFGVQDSTVFNVKDIYGAFTEPAEKNIFARVDPEIDVKIEPIVLGYGCEVGISGLASDVKWKILHAPHLTKEEADKIRSGIDLTRDDPTLSYKQKADEIARVGINVFGLQYVITTFDNYACPTSP